MLVQYFRGPRSLYNPKAHGSGIYFATDTHEILHNGVSYSGSYSSEDLPINIANLIQQVDANTQKLESLTLDGSIKDQINSAINDFATKVTDDGTIDTFKELIDYAAENSGSIDLLVSTVNALSENDKKQDELILANTEAITELATSIDTKIESAFSWENVN